MPALCKFYGMQPSEFWMLRLVELDTLVTFMQQYVRETEAAR